jgi:tetratricopeptide (TPR) repeat protein
MDPYDLPEEFSHLQAQDMSKLGFMQDLTRGIKKIVEADAPKATVKETIVATAAAINVAPLLKRAFMFLEDGDFDRADEFCEQVLNQDPENAQAYLGKLMAELRVKRQTDLANCAETFDSNKNYEKAVRFADAKLASELRGYNATIKDRNAKKAEEARKEALYLKAMDDYKSYDIVRLQDAIKVFTSLAGYKDSDERIRLCQAKIDQIRIKKENDRIERERLAEEKRIADEKARLERQRQEEIDRVEAEKRAKRNKKIAIIVTPIAIAVIAFVIVLNSVIIPTGKYNDAIALMNDGKYEEAISVFESLDGYKDSAAMLEKCNVSMYGIRGWNILKNTFIGDTFVLGTYEQNTDDSDIESIEWRVLDIDGGKLLLISSMVIDCYWYNTNYVDTTWESSSIRKWLNNEFIHNAFTEAERNLIYSISRTDSPSSTKDQIFLLSEEDALKYFDSDNERKCTATPYAEAKGCYINSQTYRCEWWLRENSYASNNISYVDLFGRIREKEYGVGDNTIGIRPAMWIDVRKWE